MSQIMYDEIVAGLRVKKVVHYIADFGRTGTQYAVARFGPRGGVQRRVWSQTSGQWSKWYKLFPASVERLATPADEARYKPDFGLAWDRNW